MEDVQTDLDTLIPSIFYLMSRYAHSQNKELILAIHRHLALLEQHPDMQSEVVKTTCRRLRNYWLQLLKKETATSILKENPEIPVKRSNLLILH